MKTEWKLSNILNQVFDDAETNQECKKLSKLWDKLCDNKFLYQEGPYPAGHGQTHIENLLSNLRMFLTSYESPNVFNDFEKSRLIAAGMIHDIGMIHMRPVGANGPEAEKTRRRHSSPKNIKKAREILKEAKFSIDSADDILDIASAHSGDDESTASEKLDRLRERERITRKSNLVKSAVLIQVADFFDLGPERLTKDVEHQQWDEKQLFHYKKHMTIRKNFIEDDRHITLYLGKDNKIDVDGKIFEITPMERYIIISVVEEEAKAKIDSLNRQFDRIWKIECEETLFGRISPMGPEMNIFKKEFKKALDEWPKSQAVFPVYFMGHSLYSRFVKNEEGLNKKLTDLLSGACMNLRVLILDPEVENQQMCEVFDAQLGSLEEKGRAILPLYDTKEIEESLKKNGESFEDKGDILESLSAIEGWKEIVNGISSLEVRATTRLMYMGICRFGDSIIVTPYRRKGLFKESVALIFKKDAPLFDAYNEVFEDIWKSRFETKIKLIKYGKKSSYNPVKHLLGKNLLHDKSKDLIPLDYERFVLEKHLDRIKAVFDTITSKEMIHIPPPIEVEIQPSEECELHCIHCIGKHLTKPSGTPYLLKTDLSSLIDDHGGNWKVKRFRLSGLRGDPLSDSAQSFTLDFIEKAKKAKRQVVILTNGLALEKKTVRKRLLNADCIHVSLDAASQETFRKIKGIDAFVPIKNNIISLCSEIKMKEESTKVGIGFVVTKDNLHEVLMAVDLARDVGAKFIRFKPDIRSRHAMPWRNWKEAEVRIKSKIAELDREKLNVIMTEVGQFHNRLPVIDRCWTQYFYTTVGSDSNLYPCDHLTLSGTDTVLGKLGTFKDVWETSVKDKRFGRRYRQCILCPPFGWRFNRLVEQLFAMYNSYSWDSIKKLVDQALEDN